MKGKAKILAILAAGALVASIGLAGCSSGNSDSASSSSKTETTHEAVTLQVFAANSLQKAMPEVMAKYQESHDWVTFSDAQYKGSGDLVTQLQGGASADLLITASKATMDTAESSDLIDPETRTNMFTNKLVVVAKTGSGIKIDSLADVSQYSICLGDESVPAGNYARQSLSTVNLYTGGEAGKGGEYVDINPLLDTSVGNVCQHVSTGDVQIGFVYTSDVYRFDGVEVVYEVPDDTHKTIVYPGAVCKGSQVASDAQEFLDWCMTDADALKIWQAWGFELAAE